MQKPKVPKQELGVKIGVPKPELGNEKLGNHHDNTPKPLAGFQS
jgi:hypothetical protein